VILLRWRSVVGLTLLAILPASLSADNAGGRAVLRSSGGVLVNKTSTPPSIAVFAGDIIENQGDLSASLDYEGSSAQINPQTVIQLEDGEIILDHGSLTVTTLRQFRVRAGCVLATPVAPDKTIYLVKDTDNRVTVIAQEKDVNLDRRSERVNRASQPDSSERDVVHQGQQRSREEHCGAGDLRTLPVDATGGILNSPYAIGAAAAIVTGVTCWALCRSDNPASPDSPSNSSLTSNHP
jgi:hypothetical protein